MTKQFTNKMQAQVSEFHEAFNHPVGDKPQLISKERFTNRQIWSAEESLEGIRANCNNDEEFREEFRKFLVGAKQAFQKQLGKPYPKNEKERIVALADAIGDKLYFGFGDAVETGIDIQPVFEQIQNSNMSKLFTNEETGEKYTEYREDGKIKKSPDFFEPEGKIEEEINKQLTPKKTTAKTTRKPKAKKIEEVIVTETKDEGDEGYIIGVDLAIDKSEE